MTMELKEEQLKVAESQLRKYLPRSQQVYGCLLLYNRVRSDPVKFLVDRWPEFSVIIYKPQQEQKGDVFKDMLVFAIDEAILEETIRKPSVIDWTRYLCFGTCLHHWETLKSVASEKDVSIRKVAVCRKMTLEDVSKLPSIDSSGIAVRSLDESHISLVNRAWKFGDNEMSVRMIQNMIMNFPTCCVLDTEGRPVSWILTYASCAIGMLYTVPEHRGKGYAKVLISTMAKKLHALDYPVYCFIEEENMVSYRLFKKLGFTEDPSHREAWFSANELEAL
ncbi:glycine N-acyltransferase-like [Mastacembelus armatus]|uniref:glycine N-acyltransferase-like n=1 Tax=Mastacembelus armatus TaxID=205130 RepID=UPI000E46037E|nr:glycine N-acyltransferase-like [Mastacembelus armatus]